MSNSMRLSSWNTEGRLSDEGLASKRGTAQHILGNLALSNFDVIFLPEAYSSFPDDDVINGLKDIAGEQGEIVPFSYDEPDELMKDNDTLNHNGMLISKLPIEDKELIKAGDYRNIIRARIGELAIYGVHLDDKEESMRHVMTNSILLDVEKTKMPSVIMGDFNATYPDGSTAKLFRALGSVWPESSGFPFSSEMHRAKGMVNGGTMEMFSYAGFNETNPEHYPTATPKLRGKEFMPSIPLLQLDHILISPELDSGDFKIEHDGGSDHRQISAEISLR